MSNQLIPKTNSSEEPDIPIKPAIFEIDVSNTLGEEYIEMFNDIVRFVVIQLGIQVMLSLSDPEHYSIFSGEFIVLIFFIIIGVLFYWLVLKKIFYFK